MPKPGWITALFKVLGILGRAAGDANEVFPNRTTQVPTKLADLAAEKKRRTRKPKPSPDAE